MPRNTFYLVIALAILAAIVAAVNVYRLLNPFPKEFSIKPTSTPTIAPSHPPTSKTYTSSQCGIQFTYPKGFEVIGDASGSAVLADSETKTAIVVSCQKNIPRPPIKADKIESFQISSVSAKLYHDNSAKDAAPIDKLIFRHPVTMLDVIIAGTGEAYSDIIRSLKILQ